MGNVYGTGLSVKALSQVLDAFYTEPLPAPVENLHRSSQEPIPPRLTIQQT